MIFKNLSHGTHQNINIRGLEVYYIKLCSLLVVCSQLNEGIVSERNVYKVPTLPTDRAQSTVIS